MIICNFIHIVYTFIVCPTKEEIGFRSLQENIDTTTAGGKLIFHVFGALAEFERGIIRERTNAGLRAARERGKRGGRRSVMDAKKIAMARTLLADPANKVAGICATLNVSKSTLYKYAKLMEEPKTP